MAAEDEKPRAWPRPASAPLPTVWRRFEGPRAMPDGRRPRFWIQDVPEDRDEEIVDFMSCSFLDEENFCRTNGVKEHALSLKEIRQMWRDLLKQRVALMAFTDWPDGTPRLAGCNVTGVTFKDEHAPPCEAEPLRKVVRALHFIEDQVDVFAKYGVNEYMTALGLSVDPAFRGQNLGYELLMARTDLGRAVGLKLTVTVFTGAASQKLSARAGFELLARVSYADYKEDGELVFPGANCDFFELKAKRIE